MRQTKLFLLLLFTLAVYGCCKDDDDNPETVSEDSMLEYFRCKINGEEFTATSNFSCDGRTFGYYPEAADGVDAGYMVLSGKDCADERDIVAIRFFDFNPELGLIDFTEPQTADSVSPIYKVSIDIKYERLISGNMNLTHFRPRELPNGELGLVQGTFEFMVSNETGDSIVNITDGEFRYRVQNSW